ncbi:DUF4435 domain-containing protein [Myxococcota bacterium]|nr:DUF4435 domain-containing protein [Myxococcota bacterium]MBU1379825.1 DUF4435 domain-containing protein [Myxococcota bacterium]MBU1496993.1 DUF4435 domain-containing protein [Myxococcota bacterium]
MDMLKVHKQSRENKVQIRFHEFITTYQKDSQVIYAFCEGKDDLSFYRGAIESLLRDNWTVQMWEVGGVDNVIELYSKLNWRNYKKFQIVFFIDRDLSEFTCFDLPKEKNIYITDNYSIENDVVNWNTCERILTEVLGFGSLSVDEKNTIKDLFNKEHSNFIDQLVLIMAWIVEWRKCKQKACLNEIKMSHLFVIEHGKLKIASNICQNVTEYIHKQCSLTVNQQFNINQACTEFRKNDRHKKYTRGKYLLWFLTEFCLSIQRDYLKILPSSSTKPKNTTNFSHSNAIVLISSRYRIPQSLKQFLKGTVELTVKKHKGN